MGQESETVPLTQFHVFSLETLEFQLKKFTRACVGMGKRMGKLLFIDNINLFFTVLFKLFLTFWQKNKRISEDGLFCSLQSPKLLLKRSQ
jgi:hypothetical protein